MKAASPSSLTPSVCSAAAGFPAIALVARTGGMELGYSCPNSSCKVDDAPGTAVTHLPLTLTFAGAQLMGSENSKC